MIQPMFGGLYVFGDPAVASPISVTTDASGNTVASVGPDTQTFPDPFTFLFVQSTHPGDTLTVNVTTQSLTGQALVYLFGGARRANLRWPGGGQFQGNGGGAFEPTTYEVTVGPGVYSACANVGATVNVTRSDPGATVSKVELGSGKVNVT